MASGVTDSSIWQPIGMTLGQTYRITGDATVSAGALRIWDSTGGQYTLASVSGSFDVIFRPTVNTAIYLLGINGFTGTVDNISVTPTTELVENGTFDAGTTGWTATNATLSVVSGKLRVTVTSDGTGYATQQINTVIGQKYLLSLEVTDLSAQDAGVAVGTTDGGEEIISSLSAVDGKVSTVFTATTTTTYIKPRVSFTAGEFSDFDNISVRPAVEDRSVNNNGLQVHGQLTKTAVATGSDLVAWSGWSSTSYLEQPYNSDLDFTGDFVIMGWVRSLTDNPATLISRGDGVASIPRFSLSLNNSTGYLNMFFNDGSTSQVVTGTSDLTTNTWRQVAFVRTATTADLYVDGALHKSDALIANGTFTGSTQKLRLGINYNDGAPISGSLALWRISGTAPTAEQIAQIYEDEKVLFQDGAQATLYGSSDAVTALAYDSDTELLSVGTSAGRSDFKGLRRVNNTTTAVTTAISASNAMIVEQ